MSFFKEFQDSVKKWTWECFGEKIATDKLQRNHRFLEEALELVQACDCTREEAHMLVDYVYGRPVGEKTQEVGGVMITLSALCNAQEIDAGAAAEDGLSSNWSRIEKIREKQRNKPPSSPLPGPDPKPHPICKNCKYWIPKYHELGHCSRQGQSHSKFFVLKEDLYTHSTFSCTEYNVLQLETEVIL